MPEGQKTKASDWLPLMDAWQQSGLTKKAFCIKQNICYKNFTKWYSRLVNASKIASVKTRLTLPIKKALFVPVEIKSTEKLNPSIPAKPLILILNKSLQLQIPADAINAHFLQMLITAAGTHSC